MKNGMSRFGGVLGIVYCLGGFFLIFLGWNGAASNDNESAQLPYVISGGLAGLGLIVVGAALMLANSLRADRVELRAALEESRRADAAAPAAAAASAGGADGVTRSTAKADVVVVGSDSYHRTVCSLVAGQAELATMAAASARESGRTPCRICNPDG